MISTVKAERILARNTRAFTAISSSLERSVGCVLREDIRADRDIPSGHKVLMDGIAFKYSAWEFGRLEFVVQGIQPAGKPPLKLRKSENCIEVMTGALLPGGCDCVVPVENVVFKKGNAVIKDGASIKAGQYIQKQGSDSQKGEVVLKKNCRLSPPAIAVAASVGKTTLKVSAVPEIAIVTTGDELVDVGRSPKPYQIRKSNSYVINSALSNRGYAKTAIFHVRDDQKQMTTTLRRILKSFDIVILSGGISMGKFDFVPSVLKSLGVAVLFHKVQQKPGKPFWFGKSKSGKPVFALPGNPVSTQMCLYRYVLPYLDRAAGLKQDSAESAVLSSKFYVHSDLTFFLPVRIKRSTSGRLPVSPCPIFYSGDFVGLAGSDGFVELEAGKKSFLAGSIVPFYRW